jgi:hypothetical protein
VWLESGVLDGKQQVFTGERERERERLICEYRSQVKYKGQRTWSFNIKGWRGT